MKTGVQIIADERMRHVIEEGWSDSHDDCHDESQLAIAAACYALPRQVRDTKVLSDTLGELLWPWDWEWWKPAKNRQIKQRIRELAKAGALIAAEIDRLQRARNA